MGGFVATYNYLSYRLIEPPFALSQSWAGAIFLVYLLGGPVSAWFGRLGSRVGRGLMMIVATLIMATGLALTATSHVAVAVVAIAVFTCGFFGVHAVASGWVSRRAETARAAAASLYLFAYYGGSSVFGSVGGLFWSRGRWPGIMALVALLIGMTLLLAWRLMRREQREAAVPS